MGVMLEVEWSWFEEKRSSGGVCIKGEMNGGKRESETYQKRQGFSFTVEFS